MSLHALFKTDPKREEAGVPVRYTNFRLTLARAGGANRAFQRRQEALLRPHRIALLRGTMPNDQLEVIYRQLYAETVVRNWETLVIQEDGSEKWVVGIEAENGDILPFTKDAVFDAFNLYPDLYDDVKQQASSIQMYRAAVQEELEGN